MDNLRKMYIFAEKELQLMNFLEEKILKVQGDPLARALRKKFKSQKQFPKRKFLCVYSDELLETVVIMPPAARSNACVPKPRMVQATRVS